MKSPALNVLLHQLGFADALANNETAVQRWLDAAVRHNVAGVILVPFLLSSVSPDVIARMATDRQLSVRACVLNPGSGPNPFKEPDRAAVALMDQVRYHKVWVSAHVSDDATLGPAHTFHGSKEQDHRGQMTWLDRLVRLRREEGFGMEIEGLNRDEDPTDDPFSGSFRNELAARNFGYHLDFNHANARGYVLAQLKVFATTASHIEVVQHRRRRLDQKGGVHYDIPQLCRVINARTKRPTLSVERFHSSVVRAFGLSEVCDAYAEGEEDHIINQLRFLRQHLAV